jgi:thiol-disulfide isomerase/thioredoxin
MTRWLGCAALAAMLAAGLAAVQAGAPKQDKKKKEDKGPSQATLVLGSLDVELGAELKAAGSDETKRKAVIAKFSPRLLEHAQKNADDPSAVLALATVLQLNPAKDKAKVRDEAVNLLKKDFVKSKHVVPSLRTLARLGGGTTGDGVALDFVKAVAKDHPDKLTRATALDELASSLEFRALFADRLVRDDKLREDFEKRLGEDFARRFIDSGDDAKREAEGLRKTLEDQYAGVLTPKDEPKGGGGGALAVGAKAPDAASVDVDGNAVKLSDYKGKVVVLDFWATWCGPCRAMIPHTRKLVKSNEKKPLVFVSVSCDQNKEDLEGFLQKTEMPWTHWWDGARGKAARAYEVNAFPTIYVVDHKGAIAFKSVGFDPALDGVVERLVREAEAAKK